jgi:transglutaminase-like putative cysteine protease
MQIRITHRTTYRYEPPYGRLVQRLRMTPQSFAGQTVIDWTISAPGIDSAISYTDGNGNMTHLIAHELATPEVVIEVAGMVERNPISGPWSPVDGAMPRAAFTRQTPLTEPSARIVAMATGVAGDGLERLLGLMHAVHGAVDYKIGATHAYSTAADAVRDGEGVCQDHAHIFISAARHLGIPSRYVTGYLVTEPGDAADAAHAWAEAWVESWGWATFDVANDMIADERYVRVAAGLDARDAAPVVGIRQGGSGSEELDVLVLVESDAAQ